MSPHGKSSRNWNSNPSWSSSKNLFHNKGLEEGGGQGPNPTPLQVLRLSLLAELSFSEKEKPFQKTAQSS